MRLFVAIELCEAIRDELARIQSHLKYSGADVKWVAKDNIHLTLKFLGEVHEEKIEKIKSALDIICGGVKLFDLSLKDIGAFPNIDFPRVIWVSLDKGAVELKALAANIDDSLSGFGFAKESRPFAAHLTIGRVRSQKNRESLKEKIASANRQSPTTNHQQSIESISLIQSALTPAGPIYNKLHESPLCTV